MLTPVSAVKAPTVIVQLVNLTDGFVHLKDGRTWPITGWLDDEHDVIPTQDGAAWFVAGRDGEGFIVEPMTAYQPAHMH